VKEAIVYEKRLTVPQNVKRFCDINGTKLEELAAQVGMSRATAMQWMSGKFRTPTGVQSKPASRLKKVLDKLFVGGIPDLYKGNTDDLFKIFGCEKCRYRMRSEKGCIKFSLTRKEINTGFYIHRSDGRGYELSASTPCGFAGGAA
jgi:transcriptional regulator with XRE-family HTH domain